MSLTVLITIISLSLLALFSSIILYFIAQKFKVFEDPRIDEVQAVLPAANCGGCGFAGCRNFAEALVKAETFEGLNCPVGGATVMGSVAKLLEKKHLRLILRLQFCFVTVRLNSGRVHPDTMVHLIAGYPIIFILVKQIAAMVVSV